MVQLVRKSDIREVRKGRLGRVGGGGASFECTNIYHFDTQTQVEGLEHLLRSVCLSVCLGRNARTL